MSNELENIHALFVAENGELVIIGAEGPQPIGLNLNDILTTVEFQGLRSEE